jgi:signal transduction histidine kinase
MRFSDAGRGFSPEALQRGSELFYSEKEGGMGIGLSVTSEVLKAMGGALSVENGLAGGAIVTFELPKP